MDKLSGMFFSVKNWPGCKSTHEKELSHLVFGDAKCELFEGLLKITIKCGNTEY